MQHKDQELPQHQYMHSPKETCGHVEIDQTKHYWYCDIIPGPLVSTFCSSLLGLTNALYPVSKHGLGQVRAEH